MLLSHDRTTILCPRSCRCCTGIVETQCTWA